MLYEFYIYLKYKVLSNTQDEMVWFLIKFTSKLSSKDKIIIALHQHKNNYATQMQNNKIKITSTQWHQ